jgi:hypothetical protein
MVRVGFLKLWFWLRMEATRVLRKIERLELQIVRATEEWPRRSQRRGRIRMGPRNECLDLSYVLDGLASTAALSSAPGLWRIQCGRLPVQRLNARENAAGSEKPTR